MKGLARLEKDSDPRDLLELFADNCTIGNVLLDTKLHGAEGAKRFWTDYRHTFKDVKSTFSRITEDIGAAVLEWTSKGTLLTGQPVEYRGATVIVVGNERIVDFMAYFDGRHLHTYPQSAH